MTGQRTVLMAQKRGQYHVALYERLSREDGDRPESDSIVNQQRLLEDYCAHHPEFQIVGHYSDDGYTGTNFDRPAFRRLLSDIEAGAVTCVIVKDLSRFGRDYIDMGHYLERHFPSHAVRFIAVNDGVDSQRGPYDMMLPLKNVFNAQYAKDISEKVRSAFEVKQRRGEFVGAFASYGYRKDPENHNHLIADPAAAAVVLRIFELAASGVGQVRIAMILNQENIPCPSAYKRLMGERYANSKKLDSTHYWTYSTVHRILQNEMYLGNMVQGRYIRPTMHGKAKKADPRDWIVAEGTHEAIVSRELWNTVQAQIAKNTRAPNFDRNVGLFAGFLKCGDCGRAMVKTRRGDRLYYSCGSYRRYGAAVCSSHTAHPDELEQIILADLNQLIRAVNDLQTIAENNREKEGCANNKASERQCLDTALSRVRRLKQSSYEDYRDKLLSRDEFLRYKADYDRQEQTLLQQLERTGEDRADSLPEQPWVDNLVRLGKLTELDRITLAQTVKEIRVFEGNKIEIHYIFSEELRPLLEKPKLGQSG